MSSNPFSEEDAMVTLLPYLEDSLPMGFVTIILNDCPAFLALSTEGEEDLLRATKEARGRGVSIITNGCSNGARETLRNDTPAAAEAQAEMVQALAVSETQEQEFFAERAYLIARAHIFAP